MLSTVEAGRIVPTTIDNSTTLANPKMRNPTAAISRDGSTSDHLSKDKIHDCSDVTLQDLPGLALQEIASSLIDTSPKSILALRKMSSTLREHPAIKAAAYAIECRHYDYICGNQGSTHKVDSAYIIQEINRCRQLDESMRMLHLVELTRLTGTPFVRHKDGLYRNLWDISTKLDRHSFGCALQTFVQQIEFMDEFNRAMWFDDLHAAIKSARHTKNALLYASLSGQLMFLTKIEIAQRFSDVFSSIADLPHHAQAIPLSQLAKSATFLPDAQIDNTLREFISHVDTKANPHSIRILFGLLDDPGALSAEQLMRVLHLTDSGMADVNDPKLQLSYMRIRANCVVKGAELHQFSIFADMLPIFERLIKPGLAAMPEEIRFLNYFNFLAPTVVSYARVQRIAGAPTILRAFAPYFKCNDVASGTSLTFSELLLSQSFPQQTVLKSLISYCCGYESFHVRAGITQT